MDIEHFNKKILNDDQFDLPNDLKLKLEDNDEVVYKICREVYLVAYNSSIQKSGEQLGMFIHQDDIKTLSKKIKESTGVLFNNVERDNYKFLLSIVKNYYIKTATRTERKDRAFVVKNEKNSIMEKLIYTDMIIDWDDFSGILIKEAY